MKFGQFWEARGVAVEQIIERRTRGQFDDFARKPGKLTYATEKEHVYAKVLYDAGHGKIVT